METIIKILFIITGIACLVLGYILIDIGSLWALFWIPVGVLYLATVYLKIKGGKNVERK